MSKPALVVRIGRGTVRAELTRKGVVTWAAESSYTTEAELTAVLTMLGAEPALPERIRTAKIELARPLVQLRTLSEMPPVREAALRALVAHQAGRFFRKNGRPLVTNVGWEPHRRGSPTIATAAAVEEPWLDAIVQGIREAGIEPVAIAPVGSSLQLLPSSDRAARAIATRSRIRRLGATAAALWAIVGGLAVRQWFREGARVEAELAALAPAAAAAHGAHQEYDAARSMVATIESAERRGGTVSAQIARILLALPDSAYLMSLHVTDQADGELTGAARRPLDVVAPLERAQVVAAPRLVGPPTAIAPDGRDYERFTVRFGGGSGR